VSWCLFSRSSSVLMFCEDRANPWSIHTFFDMETYGSGSRIAWVSCFGVWYVIPMYRTLSLICFLCTDLYGRGYSDAPQTTYDAHLYTMQLALLMQYLKWEKAIIVGYSMVRSPHVTPLLHRSPVCDREEASLRRLLHNSHTLSRTRWYSYHAQGLWKPVTYHAQQNSCPRHWCKRLHLAGLSA